MDFTTRKQAEVAASKSERRYQDLSHSMPVALWSVNTGGVAEALKGLRASGVTDLGAHLDHRPTDQCAVLGRKIWTGR